MEEVKEEIKFDKKNVIIGILIVLVLAFLIATVILAIPSSGKYDAAQINGSTGWYSVDITSYQIKGNMIELTLKSEYNSQDKHIMVSCDNCILYKK